MENLIEMIPEFLKSFNLVYVIGIISAVSSALWAYKKFLYENQLEKFKDANTNLFKTEKQEVLAAIATLGVFRRDRKFKQNTIDVLVSRLYTELDYDITNAIASALIQYSNHREVNYIADELMRINRNFFFQTGPLEQRSYALDKKLSSLKRIKDNKLNEGETVLDIERDNLAKIKQKLMIEYQKIFPKPMYELLWNKQITSDTYSRIMRKACNESKYTGRQRRVEMKLYQNDFNYTFLAKINTSKCIIENSALGSANFTDIVFSNTLSWTYFLDVVFSNVRFIKDSTFSRSAFSNCIFKNGKITGSSFIGCAFKNVTFNEITFEESFFWGATFSNCQFIDCEDIKPELFFEAKFDNTKKPFSQKSFSALKISDVSQALDDCKAILDFRKDEMKQWLTGLKSLSTENTETSATSKTPEPTEIPKPPETTE